MVFILFCILFLASSFNCSKKERKVLDQASLYTDRKNRNEYNSLVECISTTVNDMQNIFGKEIVPDVTLFKTLIESTSNELKNRSLKNINNTAIVDSIINIVYRQWDITFDPNQDNLQSLLPHTVIQHKKGSCLGVSLLFLLLAEKLDYPLYGVLLPGHFFVRYDNGKKFRNIEPNKKGYNHPLKYYLIQYNIDDDSWYNMKNLSQKETAAVLYYTIANICRKAGKLGSAKRYYRKSIAGLEDFAETWGNLAITYVSIGENDSARIAFTQAYKLRPKLEKLLQNIGAFELGLKKYDVALKAYREGLTYFPGDAELLYGAAFSYYQIGMLDSAQIYLNQMSVTEDKSSREYKLALLIKGKQEK